MNGFVLASLHSCVSCGLKVHLQNRLAAASPAWHIHYNDMIMMVSLMETFFYDKRVKLILLYCCREVIIPKTKFKHVFHSLEKHEKSLAVEATQSLFSLMSLFYV